MGMDSAKESRTTTTNTKEKAFRLLLLPAKHENVTPKKKLYKKQWKIRLQSEIAIKGTRRSHKGDKQQTGQAAKKTQREAKRPTADLVQANAFTVEHNKWAKMVLNWKK